jgi:hypothetical protein
MWWWWWWWWWWGGGGGEEGWGEGEVNETADEALRMTHFPESPLNDFPSQNKFVYTLISLRGTEKDVIRLVRQDSEIQDNFHFLKKAVDKPNLT